MTGPQEQKLMKELVRLTAAVEALAQRSTAVPLDQSVVSDADRIRQRVTFSYQALGTLTGRVSSASGREFDVRVVLAKRKDDGFVTFRGLPAGADWVELRAGGKIEVLRILRGDDQDNGGGGGTVAIPADLRQRGPDRGFVHPNLFKETDPIGSMVFLRTRIGPLVAFGPRLQPVDPTASDNIR